MKRTVSMHRTFISVFFKLGGFQPKFQSNCTALWRGYVGTWEIIENRLYLIIISGVIQDGEKAQLSTIFPDHPRKSICTLVFWNLEK